MYPELICGDCWLMDCWARAIITGLDKIIAVNRKRHRKRHGIVIIVVLIRFTLIFRSRGALGAQASLPARFDRQYNRSTSISETYVFIESFYEVSRRQVTALASGAGRIRRASGRGVSQEAGLPDSRHEFHHPDRSQQGRSPDHGRDRHHRV